MSSVGEQLPMPTPATTTTTNSGSSQTFACKTCGKPFVSVQALGGHQNAHRTERFALKRRQIEMKRQMARQASLLPRPVMVTGPSAPAPSPWPPHRYVMNSMVAPVEGADDVAQGIDLTLKL